MTRGKVEVTQGAERRVFFITLYVNFGFIVMDIKNKRDT